MMKKGYFMSKAIFLDKDGTLIPDIPYNVDPDLIELDETTIDAIRVMKEQGYLLIVVSNQSGIAKGFFTEEDLSKVWNKISGVLQKHKLNIDAFYYCPHEEPALLYHAQPCNCRKPLPGMILKAAEFRIDLTQSWMIGDILNDVEAGNRAGCSTILIDNGNETQWIMNEMRTPLFKAKNLLEAAAFIKLRSEKKLVYEE